MTKVPMRVNHVYGITGRTLQRRCPDSHTEVIESGGENPLEFLQLKFHDGNLRHQQPAMSRSLAT